MACGSENNSVYAYYRAMPDPIARHRFGGGPRGMLFDPSDHQQFVSTVCCTRKGSSLIAANSGGTTKVLELV
jgi:E3 ubiquitin-protein ligase RFWD2